MSLYHLHTIFFSATLAKTRRGQSGLLRWTGDTLEAHLTSRVNYQPKLRKILQTILAGYTRQGLKLPDGSERKLSFHLAEWTQFEITPRT